MAGRASRHRLGVIVPSSNTVVEDAMRSIVPTEIGLHVARFRVVTISAEPASRAQFEQAGMLAAAESLAEARVDHILWAGTAASWLGAAHDRAFIDAIRERFSLPATTAVTALRQRIASLGARRIGLVTPYVADLEARIIANFAAEGLETVASARLDLTVNTDYAAVGEATIEGMVNDVARAGPDAIVIVCTNLAGVAVAQAATGRLGLPVLDSVAVAFEEAVNALRGTPAFGG